MTIKGILDFLQLLSQNNNREWFNDNKAAYSECREYFTQVVASIIIFLAEHDLELRHIKPQDCLFRTHRNLRFSKDKTPYKSHFAAYISAKGKKNDRAGYYLHLQPNNNLLSGGMWMPETDKLKILRNSIMENLEEFEEIIHASDFTSYFGQLDGRRLKTSPKGFPADFIGMDYLKFKDYTATHTLNTNDLEHPDFPAYVAGILTKLYPLNRFLNYALDEHKENDHYLLKIF